MCVQLHARSSFSLLKSPIQIEEYIIKAKELGYHQIALTDYCTMFGTMHFNNLCIKHGVKPIFGLEFPIEINGRITDFLMLAKNNKGFNNLIKISSHLNSSKFNSCDLSFISTLLDDVILIVYGEGGYLESYIDNQLDLENELVYLKSIFNDFYVAISYNDAAYFKNKNLILKNICDKMQIETVALSKIYYLKQEDTILAKILKGIQENMTINNKSLVVETGRYLRSIDEMSELYDQNDLSNTIKIADLCNVTIEKNITSLPHFNTKNDYNPSDYLKNLCIAGLKKRMHDNVPKEYALRLMNELDVIIGMNFEDYFLIVYDFVRFAKTKGIYVGPGRGSAAGSLVSYCLGITHVDPIKYGLLFERFLNPDRISMPDIDLDLPDNRRQEVIDYVAEKYGSDHFAHITTFNTLAARQVLRDVARVYDIPISKVDMLCKSVPSTLKITLAAAYQQHQPFRQLVDSDKKYQAVFEIAKRLEGLPRHTSIHAAGIVISQKPLQDVVPTIAINQDVKATQYTMEYLEDLGLIKMDLLGLRNLTIIDEITKSIQIYNENFDIYKIPLDDVKTYQMISRANTLGVFQLESAGMKKLLIDLKPERFEDITATIALFRPGPMENIPLYLKNRHNIESIEYAHDDLKPFLNETYGVIVYQEQIMQIAQKIANFSLAKADILRKAMSKKQKGELEKLQLDFINGSIANGYSKDIAINLFNLILKFANYGFNKSHSVAYALIAYQLAYLKSNYPLEFYQSLLNSVIGNANKTSEYLYEAKTQIDILPVNINYSADLYIEEKKAIRMPLSLIKNVGNQAISTIIRERNSNKFEDFYDFVVRMLANKVNRKTIESLIDAGALDDFSSSRLSMLLSLDEAISYADLVRIERKDQILIDLNLVSKPKMIHVSDKLIPRSNKEKAALGFYYSSSIIRQLKSQLKIETLSFSELKNKFGYIQGFGCIQRVKQHRTKTGSLMAFVSLYDDSDELDLVIMPEQFKKYSNLLVVEKYLYFEGRIEKEGSCVARKIMEIEMREDSNG